MEKIPTVKEIIKAVEEIAPRSGALPGDPTGLQFGDTHKPVSSLMLALDATAAVVVQAARARADLLLTHHPLLYEPITPGNVRGPSGMALAGAARAGITVYSAHTNLDACVEGINASLAKAVGLRETRVLNRTGPDLYKVVVFVPPGALKAVREALFTAGAGRIGSYTRCSFTSEGTGTFLPGKGSSPSVGKRGRDERVEELRLETSVSSEALGGALDGIRKAHPYEEPAIDVYPAVDHQPATGLGLVGLLPRPETVGSLADLVCRVLKARTPRMVGSRGRKVRSVAVCAGSGSSLLDAAASAGARFFITGDMKYHDARMAEALGVAVLDVGHFAPEHYGLRRFGKLLESRFEEAGWRPRLSYAKERDPFLPVG